MYQFLLSLLNVVCEMAPYLLLGFLYRRGVACIRATEVLCQVSVAE